MSNLDNHDLRKPSLLELFLAGFFRQENIRWIAVLGAAIVVASSLMLVTREWSSWSGGGKYFVVLAYTGLCYVLSQIGQKHLGLQITSRVLQYLTLLLLPICFLALAWLYVPKESAWSGLQFFLFFLPTVALTWWAGAQIFDHLWRGRQVSFLVAFVLLSAAGALPRMDGVGSALLFGFLFWAIATVGTIKVNRHLFWLAEENRTTRAFGFLPVALLGSLFLVLVITKTFPVLPLSWIGVGIVLMSSTLLLTTRSVLEVFRQRTGGVLHPWPTSLVIPLVVGIIATFTGLVLSFHGFSGFKPAHQAPVLASLAAAYLFAQMAWDTKKPIFLWFGLGLLTFGYFLLPTLFRDWVQSVAVGTAQVIGEERLPIAFYGLTFLPLIIVLGIVGGWSPIRSRPHVTKPIQQFLAILMVALLMLSWTHGKAAFPIAVVQALLGFGLARYYSDRRYADYALVVMTIAVGTMVTFGNAMEWVQVSTKDTIHALSIWGLFLLGNRWIDTAIERFCHSFPGRRDHETVVRTHAYYLGTFLTVILFEIWIGMSIVRLREGLAMSSFGNLSDALRNMDLVGIGLQSIGLLMLVHRTRHYLAGVCFWGLVTFVSMGVALGMEVPLSMIAEGAMLICMAVSLVSGIPLRSLSRRWTGSQPLRSPLLFPLHDLTIATGVCLGSMIYVPSLLEANITQIPMSKPMGAGILLTWPLLLRFIHGNKIASSLACVAFPLIAAALLISLLPLNLGWGEVLLIWAGSALLMTLFVRFISKSQALSFNHSGTENFLGLGRMNVSKVSARFVEESTTLWLLIASSVGFLSLSMIGGVTGGLGLVGLLLLRGKGYSKREWSAWGVAVNGQLLILLLRSYQGGTWWDRLHELCMHGIELPIVMGAIAASVMFWEHRRDGIDSTWRRVWTIGLRVLFLLALLGSFGLHVDWMIQSVFMVAAMLLAIVAELSSSVRHQSRLQLGSAFGLWLVTFGWLAAQDVLVIGSGISQLALIVLSAVSLGVAHRIHGHPWLGYASRPLDQLGLVLPTLVVGFAVVTQCMDVSSSLSGLDTLVILAAASLYFHRGITTGKRFFTVSAILFVNVGSALFWNSLRCHDLQFFLVPIGFSLIGIVEILKVELPAREKTALRYIGALTILVSPVFEIVQGSWIHLLTLMVLCLMTILLAIGLRLRSLIHTGSAFLMADLLAMIVRSSVDHPGLLWIGGMVIGIAVLALAAVCENHRERLLSKIRVLTAELATWNV